MDGKMRPGRIRESDWERQKEVIHRMYMADSRTVKDIAETMARDYGFQANIWQYTHQFKRWGFKRRKLLNSREWLRVSREIRKRSPKKSQVIMCGSVLSEEKVKRETKRYDYEFERPRLPTPESSSQDMLRVVSPPYSPVSSSSGVAEFVGEVFRHTIGPHYQSADRWHSHPGSIRPPPTRFFSFDKFFGEMASIVGYQLPVPQGPFGAMIDSKYQLGVGMGDPPDSLPLASFPDLPLTVRKLLTYMPERYHGDHLQAWSVITSQPHQMHHASLRILIYAVSNNLPDDMLPSDEGILQLLSDLEISNSWLWDLRHSEDSYARSLFNAFFVSAIRQADLPVVKRLLQAGADPNQQVNAMRMSLYGKIHRHQFLYNFPVAVPAVLLALILEDYSLARLLVQSGALLTACQRQTTPPYQFVLIGSLIWESSDDFDVRLDRVCDFIMDFDPLSHNHLHPSLWEAILQTTRLQPRNDLAAQALWRAIRGREDSLQCQEGLLAALLMQDHAAVDTLVNSGLHLRNVAIYGQNGRCLEGDGGQCYESPIKLLLHSIGPGNEYEAVGIIRQMIALGVDAHTCEALHLAIEYGSVAVLETLLDACAATSSSDTRRHLIKYHDLIGHALLNWARTRNHRMIDVLVRWAVEIDVDELWKAVCICGWTDNARELVARGVMPKARHFSWAIWNGNYDIAELLLDRGFPILESDSHHPCMAETVRPVIMKCLSCQHADDFSGTMHEFDYLTPLAAAVHKTWEKGIQRMLHQYPEVYDCGALFTAVYLCWMKAGDSPELVRQILARRAHGGHSGCKNEGTALGIALIREDHAMVALLHHFGINTSKAAGLVNAFRFSHGDWLKEEESAMSSTWRKLPSPATGAGRTSRKLLLWMFLLRPNSSEPVLEMLRNGLFTADDATQALNGMDGRTFDNPALVKMLIEAGADANDWSSLPGWSPLGEACVHGSASTVRMMIELGCKVDQSQGIVQSELGATALQQTAMDESCEVMEILLSAQGVNVNEPPGQDYRCTALALAAFHGNLAMVRLLLGHGADCNAASIGDVEYGRTPLQAAAEQGHLEIVHLLLSAGIRSDGGCWRPYIWAVKLAAREGHSVIVEDLRKFKNPPWTDHDEDSLSNPVFAWTESGEEFWTMKVERERQVSVLPGSESKSIKDGTIDGDVRICQDVSHVSDANGRVNTLSGIVGEAGWEPQSADIEDGGFDE